MKVYELTGNGRVEVLQEKKNVSHPSDIRNKFGTGNTDKLIQLQIHLRPWKKVDAFIRKRTSCVMDAPFHSEYRIHYV